MSYFIIFLITFASVMFGFELRSWVHEWQTHRFLNSIETITQIGSEILSLSARAPDSETTDILYLIGFQLSAFGKIDQSETIKKYRQMRIARGTKSGAINPAMVKEHCS